MTSELVRSDTGTPRPAATDSGRHYLTDANRLRALGVLPPTVLLVVLSVLLVPGFTTRANLSELLFTIAAVGFVAVGMTFVVASGNFVDLSVVAQIGIGAVCAIAWQEHGLVVCLAAGLLACLAFGLVNGIAVAVMGANAVIVTLATTTIGAGLLTYITRSTTYLGQSEAFASFGTWRLGLVPAGALLLVVALVVAHLLLTRATFGRQVRLAGANPRFALVAGVPVPRTVIGCFLATSIGAWAAGVLLAGYSNTAYGSIGRGYEFDAMAAVVIGGNSLFGGRVSVARTAVGLVLVSVLTNILPLTGMPYEAQTIAKGLVVIVAVVLDTLVSRSSAAGRS
jgi:ribose transport system permease protein